MSMTRSLMFGTWSVIKPPTCEAPVAAMCTFRGDSIGTPQVQIRVTVGSPEAEQGGIRASEPLLADLVVSQRCSHRLHITHTATSLSRGWVSSEIEWKRRFE